MVYKWVGVFVLLLGIVQDVAHAEFSNEASDLPFPPDAQKLEFVAWAGDISFQTASTLNAVAAFYLQEMPKRGWQLDESQVEIDDDDIELVFQHGDAEVEMDFSQRSSHLQVRFDCEELAFNGVDDPAAMKAKGVPMPAAAIFFQSNFPLPENVTRLMYQDDGCMVYSRQGLKQAFDYYSSLAKRIGFQESRKPLIDSTRMYTEFKKGSAKVSVNVFTDEVGSRSIVEFKDKKSETTTPPLPVVASLPLDLAEESPSKMKANTNRADREGSVALDEKRTPVDVTRNRGKAEVTFGGKKYVFPHIAAFRAEGYADGITFVTFSSKPIPYHKLQTLVQTEDTPSFSDLYEFSSPDYFELNHGPYESFSFSIPGVGIGGKSMDKRTDQTKIENGRITGTFTMEPQEIFGKQLSFAATMDAGIISPQTRLATGAEGDPIEDPVELSENSVLDESPVPWPGGVEDVSSSGTEFRKTYQAVVPMPRGQIEEFYIKRLREDDWKYYARSEDTKLLSFKNDDTEVDFTLTAEGNQTRIEALVRYPDRARQQGVWPSPGKSRLILANAHSSTVVYTIGKTDYKLKPGQGSDDPKTALNYSVSPGLYKVTIKIPGQQPQEYDLRLSEDTTWGIIALPTGGYLPLQMY